MKLFYDTAIIRDLLTAVFSDQDLTIFCYALAKNLRSNDHIS